MLRLPGLTSSLHATCYSSVGGATRVFPLSFFSGSFSAATSRNHQPAASQTRTNKTKMFIDEPNQFTGPTDRRGEFVELISPSRCSRNHETETREQDRRGEFNVMFKQVSEP